MGITALAIGLALCGAGLWLLLRPAQYEAVVHVRVHEESYGAFYIPTESQVISSQTVLKRVIDTLNLSTEWGNRYAAGRKLETAETIKLLKSRIQLRVLPNNEIIEIGVTSESSDEAARIADAIAAAYHDYREANYYAAYRDAMKTNVLKGSGGSGVTVLDSASPPRIPINRNYTLDAVLLICGLAATLLGCDLIFSAPRAAETKP